LKTPISVGIPAFNEERNISKLLTALLRQKTELVDIDEIIVVSSGSSDKTDMIVREFSEREEKVKLVQQEKREGKASAVNEILRVADNDIIVLESADTLPFEKTIEKLCSPLQEDIVGMSGGHPLPVNDASDLMGYTVHLLWRLHHQLALKRPKCGELIAIKRVFRSIPKNAVVDEAWIEHEIRKRGYEIVYVSEALVYNRGPETVGDFFKQRRRIACGHLDLHRRTGYTVSSSNFRSTMSIITGVLPSLSFRQGTLFVSAFILEGTSRLFGYYDYLTKTGNEIWEISSTTKELNT
jgi:biofilm PGA synthesis N-glycosyltransferase PgaC